MSGADLADGQLVYRRVMDWDIPFPGAERVSIQGVPALLGVAMLLSSRVAAAWQLYLAFGVLGAAGSSAFYVPLSATATRWFAARRGLALGLVSAGMGLGIMVTTAARCHSTPW